MNKWICDCCAGCFSEEPHVIKCKIGASSTELEWLYCDECWEDNIVPMFEGKNIRPV